MAGILPISANFNAHCCFRAQILVLAKLCIHDMFFCCHNEVMLDDACSAAHRLAGVLAKRTSRRFGQMKLTVIANEVKRSSREAGRRELEKAGSLRIAGDDESAKRNSRLTRRAARA